MGVEQIVNLVSAAFIFGFIVVIRLLDARADRLEHERKVEILKLSHWVNEERDS